MTVMCATSDGPLKGIRRYREEPLVSSDVVTGPGSCIADGPLTRVIDNQDKVVGRYDNEWDHSHGLADLTAWVASKA